MKKLLIALFLALIIGFSIVGFTQSVTNSNDAIVETDDNTMEIKS